MEADANEEELVKETDLFPGCADMDEFLQEGYPIIMEGIRSSNGLPQEKRFSYYKTFPEFSALMKNEGKHLQDIMQKVVASCGVKKQISNQAMADKFDVITDLNDRLLDRVVKNLSEMDGTRFNPNEDFGESSKKVSGSWNKNRLAAAAAAKEREDEEIVQLVVQTRTIRPQVLFKDKIDNRNVPWVPKIAEKPNQLKPLCLVMAVDENGKEYYRHPYEYELSLWKPQDEWLVSYENVQVPSPVEETPLVNVDTEEQLDALLEDLKKQKMFAVDLEAHSYRTYMGFVCLMQISTEETDYLVDALKLRHKLHILNEVFTKPTILKIFHGASCDIEWLQRDFNIYVVGMFDTYSAAKALEYPKLNLAYLLKKFCDIDANKKFQLFDWRIRPLPPKAMQYAREDTHYLMYIFKMMANELIEQGMNKPQKLAGVFMNSCLTCQKVFTKPRWDEDSHMSLYRRMKRHFDNRQLYALKEVYKWRDTIAREEDESPGYVLPNHMMMQICQTLPRELQGILGCCNPVPPLVRQHALAIHQIILRAKEQPLVKSTTDIESAASKSSQFSVSRDVDLEIRLNTYVHDSTSVEMSDDMPTLMAGSLPDLGDPPVVEPKLPLLLRAPTPTKDDVKDLANRIVKITFVPPYERYKKVLPYSIQEEKERIEKERQADELRMQKSTEVQYSSPKQSNSTSTATTTPSKPASPPKRPHLPTPLASEAGAKKKMRPSQKKAEPETSADVDDVLPIVKAEAALKREREEEEMALRIGVCGGSISKQKRGRGKQDNAHQDRPNSRTPTGQGRRQNQGPQGSGVDPRFQADASTEDADGQSYADSQDDGFQPFDYSSVNFDKFHSRSSSGAIHLNSDDKRKNGKKKNQQFKGKQFNRRRGGGGGSRGGGGRGGRSRGGRGKWP
ncbi:PMC2NT (NUC016) domain [Nesidiocoris tenuis]|uniref:PMC2NT (NUC016) domain n=1 Tax=Nesidiocoris tenuis TaxID=355587 RepID=A0ABN7B7L0_9HEMI|nr:PMC2NT (NUC016) domain [Nesidiocoris tenuis]